MGNKLDLNGHVLVGWKLYYDDGSIIRSTEMRFDDTPQNGVQVLVRYYRRPDGSYSKEVLNGYDVYTLRREDPLTMELPVGMKRGSYLEDDDFDSLMLEVRQDTEVIMEMI